MIFVAIPILREYENVAGLLADLRSQSYKNFKTFFCVNNPASWLVKDLHQIDVEDNAKTLQELSFVDDLDVVVIDKSSYGNAFDDKVAGVGMARKVMMDRILSEANPEDLIVSLDADTHFLPDYFASVAENFTAHKSAVGMAVPYYHLLTDNEVQNQCILRYEVYMRHYCINLLKINNPYSFTALGSAMAFPAKSYLKVGGMTARTSGEDFYFMQNLCKTGKLLLWNDLHVYPQARYSDRVAFGTGPAMAKGKVGDWKSYPFYDEKYFQEVKNTYNLFPALFVEDVATEMDDFFEYIFKTKDLWSPLRKNFKTVEQFVRACTVKIDALRILQFLRFRQKETDEIPYANENLSSLRDKLFEEESLLRKKHDLSIK
ncbi:MAG: hypothetical protein PHU62_05330 [Bacteroidales bacterium]|jgi:hypothetical protein|nr:glycosyltransferase family 2 protein [Bacteroidales bacterium]MDD2204547.1 hypothetical protein [Bacteroidales bacterium]MDD3152976.1 hypothetical protein [Bacteroidales bacterium]MDD3913488.1 hypothetical protein [Bacteroidales bacterium]MDD4633977.1 hypothetical protein [Bacteroidales bacterium]